MPRARKGATIPHPAIGQVWQGGRNRREVYHAGDTLVGFRSPQGTEYMCSPLSWREWVRETGATLVVDLSDPKDGKG